MNWMEALSKTYDVVLPNISEYINDSTPLVPVCHSTNLANVQVVIDGDGNFRSATVVPKKDATTMIPCTEESAGRTSGLCAHPFCDKLQYVAWNYSDYAREGKKSGYGEYIKQLDEWCDSKFGNSKVRAVRDYVKKGTLIDDLIRSGVLILGSNGRFAGKESESEAEIFKVVSDYKQGDSFVRWEVEAKGSRQTKTWLDSDIHKSWQDYYTSIMGNRGVCSVTGEDSVIAISHPMKIRHSGDKAKLISSNDMNGYTYRGRFERADQLCAVGYLTTQKAHAALRWLIGRQGYRNDGMAIVSWAIAEKKIPNFIDNISDFDEEFDEGGVDFSKYTGQELAHGLNKRIRGYYGNIDDSESIITMVLDSATPGRMSIVMYRELKGSKFLSRIESWHEDCAWIHKYVSIKDADGKFTKRPFVGAPSPKDIALAAYGKNADAKMVNHAISRILPCIIDGDRLPPDLVEAVVTRASNPMAMEPWEWNKTISIACSMYRRENLKEGYEMVLNEEQTNRDYLYGRLLAVAQRLEARALFAAGEGRQTNAERLMQRFRDHPYTTWVNIEMSLRPYIARLGVKAGYYQRMISKITDMFSENDYKDDRRLSGEFLLGFHSQNEAFLKKKEIKDEEETEELE